MTPQPGQIWRWLGNWCEPDESDVLLIFEREDSTWVWFDVDSGEMCESLLTVDHQLSCWKQVL